ncbi:hypothetical protein Q8W40_19470 [Vibrio penaeicida]|uniref:hypothetical protein n=1 Tax=Vibrio penaeicida TaxID=104609 RepID=UPI002733FDE7|nr:hypothetical protein [Vibrio penaeicida]MDP2574380.1 hypothetical protein [Vibrio penaeicida]
MDKSTTKRTAQEEMMFRLGISNEDRIFCEHVEQCLFPISDFDHKSHIRLAYLYLTQYGVEDAVIKVREVLFNLLKYNDIEPLGKYHETLTKAWLLAVKHFMNKTEKCTTADEFIKHNPALLDTAIMMTHYKKETLFSARARAEFIEPDLLPIPRN